MMGADGPSVHFSHPPFQLDNKIIVFFFNRVPLVLKVTRVMLVLQV
jgi:hypothetical protein